jgi:hypothetical protein
MFARKALGDIVEPLKNMVGEMVEYALEPCGARAQLGLMRCE